MSQDQFQNWLKNLESKISPVELELGKESWNLATTGKKEHVEKVAKLRSEYRLIFTNKKEFEQLSLYKKNSSHWDPVIKRQLEILWFQYAENQMDANIIEKISTLEADLESIYSNFRGKMDGKTIDNNTIRKVLKTSKDSNQCKAVWLASKQIGEEVKEKLLKLVHLRNEGANKSGFNNYYAMSLELDELQEKSLFSLLDDLAKKSKKAYLSTKKELDQELTEKFNISKNQLRPWHYADPFFQEAPPSQEVDLNPKFKNIDIIQLTKKTFEGLGFFIDDILEKSDLFAREGKDQGAFCTMIGRTKDVRILCNLEPTEYWMSTMLHEMGHGIYDYYLEKNLPYFLYSPAHILSTEAIAMLFGRLTRNKFWLKIILGLPENEVETIVKICITQEKRSMLIFLQWVLVMCHFERELYNNPNQNLNHLWWQLVEKYQDISLEEERNKPDWGAKLHIALAPVYYQNYILGELTASQLLNYLLKNFNHSNELIKNKNAGKFLKNNYFKHGASYPWDVLIQKVTGEKLNPNYYLKQFVD